MKKWYGNSFEFSLEEYSVLPRRNKKGRYLMNLIALIFFILTLTVSCTSLSPHRKIAAVGDGTGFTAQPTIVPNGTECQNPANAIIAENCQPGTPMSVWTLPSNSLTNNGFTDKFSYLPGDVVQFKIQTNTDYRIDIYRLGFYQGYGARQITSLWPSHVGPENQPTCLLDSQTNMTECSNWTTSISWTIPTNQISGIFIAKIWLTSGTGSLIPFVVRRSATAKSDILLQTADMTWQAYNYFGGCNTYECWGHNASGDPITIAGRASVVSYLRPFMSEPNLVSRSWIFNMFADHYPTLRWLERNGYDVSYVSGRDVSFRSEVLKNAKVFISAGHDEYQSLEWRKNITAARDTGLSLMFLSGNKLFERVRFDSSQNRFMSVKLMRRMGFPNESNSVLDTFNHTDPTTSWRDGRYFGYADTQLPENNLTGLMYTVNNSNNFQPIRISGKYRRLRQWRNTAIARLTTDTSAYVGPNKCFLGYELDQDMENGFRPGGLFTINSTHIHRPAITIEMGPWSGIEEFNAGQMDYKMSLYRKGNSWVFDSGNIFYGSGLDGVHATIKAVDGSACGEADINIQGLTVNILSDMGVTPKRLQSGLTLTNPAFGPAPALTINAPSTAQVTVSADEKMLFSGTATVGSGAVSAVELSFNGGQSWHSANGTNKWSYGWIPNKFGTTTVQVRAVNDSGVFSSVLSKTVVVKSRGSIWGEVIPSVATTSESAPVGGRELGIQFSSVVSGQIDTIRFYKNHDSGGAYSVHLWNESGQLLASGSISLSASSNGWIVVSLDRTITITPNRRYIASYNAPNKFAVQKDALSDNRRFFRSPLVELGSVYSEGPFSSTQSFPRNKLAGDNYWVDIGFSAASGVPSTSLLSNSVAMQRASYHSTTVDSEAGTKIQFLSDGYVKSIRFFKSGSDRGVHIGTLWMSDLDNPMRNTLNQFTNSPHPFTDHMVAQTAFRNETTSGWQVAYFPQPIFVTKGTRLIVGLLSQYGFLQGSVSDLSEWERNNGLLQFIESTQGDGVTLPKSVSSTSHYFIDVDFSPTASSKNTLWNDQTEPHFEYVTDVSSGKVVPYELGTKFWAQADGFVTGVRFYRSQSSSGPFSSKLWIFGSSSPLASTSSFSTSTTGWVESRFSKPVRVLADNLYQASYFTPTGFSVDIDYFKQPFGVRNFPLRASGARYYYFQGVEQAPSANQYRMPLNPTWDDGGPNGTATANVSAYPQDLQWNNYWVEPVFSTELPNSGGEQSPECSDASSGTTCASGTGRCDGFGACLICNSWCRTHNQCEMGTVLCTGAQPVCQAAPTASGTFCRAANGEEAVCDGRGVCGLGTSPVPTPTPTPTPTVVVPDPATYQLTPGQSLAGGQMLTAGTNCHFYAVMQTDGNLVLYRDNQAIWNTKTSGNSGARLIFQSDGNLVLYRKDDKAIWNSGTSGKGGTVLVLQGDGHLVLYNSAFKAIWSSNPAVPGCY